MFSSVLQHVWRRLPECFVLHRCRSSKLSTELPRGLLEISWQKRLQKSSPHYPQTDYLLWTLGLCCSLFSFCQSIFTEAHALRPRPRSATAAEINSTCSWGTTSPPQEATACATTKANQLGRPPQKRFRATQNARHTPVYHGSGSETTATPSRSRRYSQWYDRPPPPAATQLDDSLVVVACGHCDCSSSSLWAA